MFSNYWPAILMVAGVLGISDYPKLAWIVLFVAGLVAILPV